jgi:hypothetical protein
MAANLGEIRSIAQHARARSAVQAFVVTQTKTGELRLTVLGPEKALFR